MPKFIKIAELHKLGFNPEAFTRVSPAANRQFVREYKQDTVGERARHSFITPWTVLLGALGFYTSQKSKSKADRPDSIIPFLTASLVAIIGIKRWGVASKNERRRFVKSYNKAMGTTYQVEHPKMQAFWDMAHAKRNRVDHLGKYGEYYPDRVYQSPGYDANAE